MRPAFEQVRSGGSPARHPAAAPGTRSPVAGVLALQRKAGNAATRRLLARSPRKPYQHQWENPALLETIYPAREAMLKKFVSLYREIELRDLTDPAARQQVINETRAAMQAEVDKLKASATPSPKELARIKELEATLKRGQGSVDKAFEDAVRWEREHRADPLAGEALMKEVRRLFGTKGVPDWLEPLVLDYAGMRYKSAHGSYYSPVRLLFMIERARGTWTKAREAEDTAAQEKYKAQVAEWEAKDPNPKKRGKAPAKPKAVKESGAERTAMEMSPEAAIARLEKMHDAGEIPAWAWHKIVRLTELRTWYAETGWEDESKEKPPPGADPVWVKAMADWTGKERLGKHGYGITGWRTEIHRRNALITTRMVCNELSEATQRHRGIDLTGGISKNAQQYVEAAAAGAKPGAKKAITGAYFKEPTKLEDFRPGAALFWINRSDWEVKEPDDSNKVRAIPGARYPMPPPPEYKAAWKAWRETAEGQEWATATKAYEKAKKAWDVQAAKAKTPEAKAKLPAAPTKPEDKQPKYTEPELLPSDGQVVNGWTYTVKPGEPITRSKDGVTHWLRWQHQATVLRAMPDGRIFTFETTDALAGSARLGVSGFGVRSLGELTRPGVFVGYMPGEVDEPIPAAAAAGTADGNGKPVIPLDPFIEDLIELVFD